ncbi:hypothetical protein F2Q68_00032928 [Brassica cretica]|uniref:Uncharacterized protein n=1 Tax=Brassica cretica TaxID=69181 RepID=A0A8S9G462_BRACR|nr:hypothetical protein F2Q68_00032928 [Brassica cretica]
MDSTKPFTQTANFVDLLNSQQDIVHPKPFHYASFSSQVPGFREEAISQATTNDDHPTKRPVGVKAAKGAGGKRNVVDQLGFSEYQRMWSIKEQDLADKERLKMGLLQSLIDKNEPDLSLKKL